MNYAQRACLILRDEPKKEEGNLVMVGSDESVDRYNSIIRVSGWVLDNFLKNPVFLWCHNAWDLPVGRAVDVKKDTRRKQLLFELAFPSKETYDFGHIVGRMYAENFLNASSVGFEPIKITRIDEPKEAKEEGFETDHGVVYEKQELYELSAVPVPGNPNALKKELDELAKRCAFKLPEANEEVLSQNWWNESFGRLRGAIERTRWAPSASTLRSDTINDVAGSTELKLGLGEYKKDTDQLVLEEVGTKRKAMVSGTVLRTVLQAPLIPTKRELTQDDQEKLKEVFASITGSQTALAQARETVESLLSGAPTDDENENDLATKGDVNRVLETVETLNGSLQKLAVGQGTAKAKEPESTSAKILEEGPLVDRLNKLADGLKR